MTVEIDEKDFARPTSRFALEENPGQASWDVAQEEKHGPEDGVGSGGKRRVAWKGREFEEGRVIMVVIMMPIMLPHVFLN